MIIAKITYWNNIAGIKTNYEVPIREKDIIITQIQDHICDLLEGPGEIYWDRDLYGDDIDFNGDENIHTRDYNDFYHILDLNPGAKNIEIAYVGINYII